MPGLFTLTDTAPLFPPKHATLLDVKGDRVQLGFCVPTVATLVTEQEFAPVITTEYVPCIRFVTDCVF